MMPADPHVTRILEWRESFSTLPDAHFFEIIRMYLGEIKTPFNKQKLIEELGSFLRREENRRMIISLLSDSDLQVVAAVDFIPNATQEKLTSFFSGTILFAAVYERLLNLEERLILYRYIDKASNRTIIKINPMLEDVIKPYLSKKMLLPVAENYKSAPVSLVSLTSELLAAFISYISAHPDLCKSDGLFKKHTVTELEVLFPGRINQLRSLMVSFINLSLVREDENRYVIAYSRLLRFADLSPLVQYAYLTVASQGRFSREGFLRQAQLLIDCASSIPSKGFSRTVLLRSAFLISEQDDDISGLGSAQKSRFSEILERARSSESNSIHNVTPAGPLFDRLIDSAVLFGLLIETGVMENDEKVYVPGLILTQSSESTKNPLEKQTISIDAGFTVNLLPGLTFAELLPVVMFMDIRRYDTVARFEITRKAVMRAFDSGLDADSICVTIEKYCPYGIPQNLKVSIEDWSRSYDSAALYKGYILRVSKENCILTEHNPVIAPLIRTIIAPGLYLLSVKNDEEAASIIEKSGIDFIGTIRTADPIPVALGFPDLKAPRNMNDDYLANNAQSVVLDDASQPFKRGTSETQSLFFQKLRTQLGEMNLSPEQNEDLLSRIQRKIVLNSAQLRGDSVRSERLEAGGMDFLGKIHVIEHAITINNMIEIEYEPLSDSKNNDPVKLLGVPLSIEKEDDDALVCLRLEPDHTEKYYSIGKARLVKRIRSFYSALSIPE